MKDISTIYLILVITVFCPAQEISLSIIDTIYLEVPDPTPAIYCLSSIGDINSDGFEDFGVSYIASESTYVDLYFGNATMDFEPSWRFYLWRGVTPYEVVGPFISIENIGDVNGDGYDDLAFGTPRYFSPYDPFYRGRIWVFYGGAIFDETLDFAWSDGDTFYYHYFGRGIADLGDWDGDLYDDFAVSAPWNDIDALGQVYLIWGNNPLDSTDFVEWSGTVFEESFGNWIISADFEGDLVKELLIWNGIYEHPSDSITQNIFSYSNTNIDTLFSIVSPYDMGPEFSFSFSVIKHGYKDIAFSTVSANEYGVGYRIEKTSGYWEIESLDYNEIFSLEDTSIVISLQSFHELKDLNGDGLSEMFCQVYPTTHFCILDPADSYNVMFDDTFFDAQGFATLDYNGDGFDEVFAILNDAVFGTRVIVLSTSPELKIRDASTFPEALTISAHPNPFNSAVTIALDGVGGGSPVPFDVEIYDVNGRMVEGGTVGAYCIRPFDGSTRLTPTTQEYIWTPDESLPSGVYLVRARFASAQRPDDGRGDLAPTGNAQAVKRVVYLK